MFKDSDRFWWTDRGLLKRFVVDLITGELRRLRPGAVRLLSASWPDTLTIDQDLGADSLELMQLATALAESLHMHEAGIEDYLLTRCRISDWCDIAADSLDIHSETISFVTSGTTGMPKNCPHELVGLLQEVAFLAELFQGAKRLYFAVPSHHIYGFLFTILLPRMLRLDPLSVIDLRTRLPSVLPGVTEPGDLVVGHPEFWRASLHSGMRYAAGVTGVTSTGPCPAEVSHALATSGLGRFVQIYGSSETGGIGWRAESGAGYGLFPFWSRDPHSLQQLNRVTTGNVLTSVIMPDRLDWFDDRHFTVAARHDAAVQVGGINVFPAYVADLLKQHQFVADAQVRLMRPDEGSRLKAYVVLAALAQDTGAAIEEVRCWIDATLPVAQRPKALTFGSAIPINAMGKPCDWLIDGF